MNKITITLKTEDTLRLTISYIVFRSIFNKKDTGRHQQTASSVIKSKLVIMIFLYPENEVSLLALYSRTYVESN